MLEINSVFPSLLESEFTAGLMPGCLSGIAGVADVVGDFLPRIRLSKDARLFALPSKATFVPVGLAVT